MKKERKEELKQIKKYLRITRIKRAFTARVISLIITSMVGWVITGNPYIGFTIGTADLLIKMFTYYGHETLWELKMTKDIRKIKQG